MKKIDVFTNGGRPEHLAIQNERVGSEFPSHRAACGKDTSQMPVTTADPEHLTLPCPDCNQQLGMWRKLHEPKVNYGASNDSDWDAE